VGQHDDLVIAAALACWMGEVARFDQRSTVNRLI
jgi:hypothetical protein